MTDQVVYSRAYGRAQSRLRQRHRHEFLGLFDEELAKAVAEDRELKLEADERAEDDRPLIPNERR